MAAGSIARILSQTKVIAVLGLRDDTDKAGQYVPEYLAAQGYLVIGVNPRLAGQFRFGERVVAKLEDIKDEIDMVDVFRRVETLPDHLPEIVGMRPRPKVVWLQQGLRHKAFAQALESAEIEVVQDRCTMAEHMRLQRKSEKS